MLGKLLKYDLKWIYKVVVVFYVLAFIFSVIGRGLNSIENSLIFSVTSKIAFGFAISMIVSSLINCLMRVWARFVINVYKDESYLTHTLPIEKKTIYSAKILSALISVFTTVVVGLFCLFICYYSQENIEALKSVLELAASTYNTTVIKLLLLISVVLFLEIMFILFMGIVGIIIGHKSNQNKMLKSIVIGFVLYLATQMLTLGLIAIFGVFNPNIMNLINTTDTINIDAIKIVMYFAILIYLIYIMFYYILGLKQFEKGVNVE